MFILIMYVQVVVVVKFVMWYPYYSFGESNVFPAQLDPVNSTCKLAFGLRCNETLFQFMQSINLLI